MVAFSQENLQDDVIEDPTPQEIRDRSRAIRRRWSERTRKRRRVVSRDERAWSVPTVELTEIAAAASK